MQWLSKMGLKTEIPQTLKNDRRLGTLFNNNFEYQ